MGAPADFLVEPFEHVGGLEMLVVLSQQPEEGQGRSNGHLHGQDLAPAVPIDPDRDQHRLAHHDAGLAHLLVAGVEDEEAKGS